MWELDHKESWAPKNWCFWTVVLEKTLKSFFNCKEIKAVNPKGNQSWIFFGMTDAEAETPVLWPCGAKNWLIGKDPDAGKDWWWDEKGMRGWDGWMASPYQWTWDWASFGSWWWTVKPGMLQSMRHKESDVTEQLNWNELKQFYFWANFVYHLMVNGSTALGPLSPVNHYSEVCLWLWIALCSHCSSETSRFGFKPSKKGRK